MNSNNDVKIISIGTLKGGVGKSTILFNIAGELAFEKKKVLVIDLDPQGNSTNNFGVNTTDVSNTVNNCFIDVKEPSLIVVREPLNDITVDILPSDIRLTQVDMQLISKTGRERLLMKYVSDNYSFFNNYDYILIDTNPSMSVINQNAFVLSDDIIIITESSMNSLSGCELFIKLWEDITNDLLMKNNISGVIINKFEKTQKSTKEFVEFLTSGDSSCSKLVLNTKISKAVVLKDTTELDNLPIAYKKTKTRAADEFKKLIVELKENEVL